jgi:hypothetical protein
MRYYLMVRVTKNEWKCLHTGTRDDCTHKGMELDDTSEWMVCQEVRYSSGRESFTL